MFVKVSPSNACSASAGNSQKTRRPARTAWQFSKRSNP